MKNSFLLKTIAFILVVLSACHNSNNSIITQNSKGKILIVVTSNDSLKDGSPAGYYLPEVMDYFDILSIDGYEMEIASPLGGKAPMYDEVTFMRDNKFNLEKTGLLKKLENTIPLSKINSKDYIAVHCVGGFAAVFDLPTNQNLKDIIREIYENKGVVSAVCHGPSALLNVKLSNEKYMVDGIKITSRTVEEDTDNGSISKEEVLKVFPMILEDELRKQGAIFTKGAAFTGHIEVSGKLITGQGVPSTVPLAKEVLKILNAK